MTGLKEKEQLTKKDVHPVRGRIALHPVSKYHEVKSGLGNTVRMPRVGEVELGIHRLGRHHPVRPRVSSRLDGNHIAGEVGLDGVPNRDVEVDVITRVEVVARKQAVVLAHVVHGAVRQVEGSVVARRRRAKREVDEGGEEVGNEVDALIQAVLDLFAGHVDTRVRDVAVVCERVQHRAGAAIC
jgi:hypothetical protein